MDIEHLVHEAVRRLVLELSNSSSAADTNTIRNVLDDAMADTPWSGVLQAVIDRPAEQGRQDVLVTALRAMSTSDPQFAQVLANTMRTAENSAPTTTTVTAGGDQKFRGMVNIGSGSLTVDRSRKRNIRIGLGAVVLLVAGGTTAAVIATSPGTPGTQVAAPETGDNAAAAAGSPTLKQLVIPHPELPNCTAASTPGHSSGCWPETLVDLAAGKAETVANPAAPRVTNSDLRYSTFDQLTPSAGAATTYDVANIGWVPGGQPPGAPECQSQALSKSARGHGYDFSSSSNGGKAEDLLHNGYCISPTHTGRPAFFRIDALRPAATAKPGGTTKVDLVISYITY